MHARNIIYWHIECNWERTCIEAESFIEKTFFLGFNEEVQKEPPKTGVQSEIFQGRESFGELGHFDKHFVKNLGKERSRLEKVWSFSLRYA